MRLCHAGLSSLSQSELAMVMQLTEEIKAEPEAITNALESLNLVSELSDMPSSADGAATYVECSCSMLMLMPDVRL